MAEDNLSVANTISSKTVITQLDESVTNRQDWSGNRRTAFIGDFNGDDFDDVLLQAENADLGTLIFNGSSNGLDVSSKREISQEEGTSQGDWSDNRRAAFVGDFNGDGFDDVLLQAENANRGTLIFNGSSSGIDVSSKREISAQDGTSQQDWSDNRRAAFVGDFNGDGFDDVLLQGNDDGRASLIFNGSANGLDISSRTEISAQDGTNKIDWSGERRAAFVANFDGDGDDVLLQGNNGGRESIIFNFNPSAFDLTVESIEITQGIQTVDNTIPLVAERSTAVRVTLDVDSIEPIPGVTGRLHVFVDGVEITPTDGVLPINPLFTAPLAPERSNENDTLNFELPAPTGIPESSDVDFRVDITPVPGELNPANNSATFNDFTFVEPITPNIFFTRIDYTPSGLGLPDLDLIEPGVGDAFVRGIFPVNDADPDLYQIAPSPTLEYSEDEDKDGILEKPDRNGLYKLLSEQRQLIVKDGLGANNNTFLYGWLAEDPSEEKTIDGNGLARSDLAIAFGNTDLTRHQRTFAHELGHLFGLSHNSRTLSSEVGWDVGGRLDGNPTDNNTTGRLKPTTLNDIMHGGLLTDQAWVDTETYKSFLNSGVSDSGDSSQSDLAERVLVVQGIFDLEGQELLELETFRYPWRSQPSPLQQDGQFMLEVVDEAGGSFQISFNALSGESDVSGIEEEEFGFFQVMVPVPPDLEVASLRITDLSGNQEFGSLQQSAAPQISIVEPLTGAFLGEETQVAWEISDPDTPLEELDLQLAYSPDNGQSFVPIAVDVSGTENSITFNSTEIQESLGDNGLIRVFVSDGLNTAFADVSELTTLEAQFPAPEVSNIIATREDDLLIGTPDPDNIDALRGDDTVRGLEGDDTLIGNKGKDNIDGNEGNDQLEGGKDEDTLDGSQGEDTLKGEKADDLLEGGDGNDLLEGGKDEDTLNGGDGDDTLNGEKGDDILDGGEGNDLLDGGDREDTLTGGTGNDTLKGGDNDDMLIGVDPTAFQPGIVEIDILTGDDPGDEDDDLFVLGDESWAYYQGSNDDYALITDFDEKDMIQLNGRAEDYELLPSPAGLPNGTAIFLTRGGFDEVIGIVQGTSELDLSDDKVFSFV